MIKRALLLALFLFAAYNVCLWARPFRERFIVQSQVQDNIARAQDFYLGVRPTPYVVVGSSLSARLTDECLGPDFCNLAFSGGSLFTGVELVSRQPGQTKVAVIESNMVMRGEDELILANVFRPLFRQLRPYLPALRERYQPANFIAGKLGEKIVGGGAAVWDHVSARLRPARLNDGGPQLFDRLLADEQARYGIAPEVEQLDRQMAKVQRKVAELEARGIECVFVEMPIDASLTRSPLAHSVREAFIKAFPLEKYRWLRPEPDHLYQTTDGCHLRGDEAAAFGHRLRAFLAAQVRPAAGPQFEGLGRKT